MHLLWLLFVQYASCYTISFLTYCPVTNHQIIQYADIVERSIRDVLAVVPDDIKQGVSMQTKPYVPYVPRVRYFMRIVVVCWLF